VVHALHEGAVEVALAAGVEEAGDAAHFDVSCNQAASMGAVLLWERTCPRMFAEMEALFAVKRAPTGKQLFVEVGVTRHHVVDAEVAFDALAARCAVALPQRSIGSVAQ